ncbi:MAG: GNAT family N-acetyltransferase [Myxococcota bacterium]
MVLIKTVSATDKRVVQVIAAHIQHGDMHYPAESNHHLTPSEHEKNEVLLYAAFVDQECCGVAGLQHLDRSNAELKTMHVLQRFRGKGIGRTLVDRVIHAAQSGGYSTIWLETGSRKASSEARRLYERIGFSYCGPFGRYKEDPESVFMCLDV